MEPNSNHPYGQVPLPNQPPPFNQPPPGVVYNYAEPQYYPPGSYPSAPEPNTYYAQPIYNQPYQQPVQYVDPRAQVYSSGHNPNLNNIPSKISSECTCPHCHQRVMTDILRRPGNTAWIICLILCCFCFPLCIYPLICDPCLDTYHVCPRCKEVISVKSP